MNQTGGQNLDPQRWMSDNIMHSRMFSRILWKEKQTFDGSFILMGDKRKGQFICNVTRGSIDLEVNKHGRAGWQGNKISPGEANRGPLDLEVNKKSG